MTTHVNTKDFDKEVLASKIPVIVDFWAEWCGPCRMMGPIFEETSKDYAGKVKFVKVDIDANQGLATKYDIQGIPNLVIFNGGKPVGQLVGLMQKSQLKSQIDAVLAKIK